MRLIGLTGGIATGKTTVSRIIQDFFGIPVINVDDVSRIVTQKGSLPLSQIVFYFGDEALNQDGTLNRAFMRSRIISSENDRKILEGIVVPAILDYVERTIQDLESQGNEIIIVENALMFEQNTYQNYQEIIVVTCDPIIQLQRVMKRDGATEESANGIIKLQYPLAKKESLANYVIYNNREVDSLESQIINVWSKIQEKE